MITEIYFYNSRNLKLSKILIFVLTYYWIESTIVNVNIEMALSILPVFLPTYWRDWSSFCLLVQLFSWQNPSTHRWTKKLNPGSSSVATSTRFSLTAKFLNSSLCTLLWFSWVLVTAIYVQEGSCHIFQASDDSDALCFYSSTALQFSPVTMPSPTSTETVGPSHHLQLQWFREKKPNWKLLTATGTVMCESPLYAVSMFITFG